MRGAVWFALALLLTPALGRAEELAYIHIVRKGETLASIAQRYYGDAKRESVLVSENGLTDQGGSAIVEGLRLVIPTVRFHRVEAGDTWRGITERYFGTDERVAVLLRANEQKPGDNPDEGAQLLIPYPVRHVVRQGESLPQIAEMYYGDRAELRLIKAFNNTRVRLGRGHILLIPLLDLRLSEGGRKILEEELGTRIDNGAIRERQARIDAEIPRLREHVLNGRFAEALVLGNQLLGTGELTGNQEISIQRELATAFIAIDREDLAADAFERTLQKQPDFELDSLRTSPRVLAALERAKKKASERKRAH